MQYSLFVAEITFQVTSKDTFHNLTKKKKKITEKMKTSQRVG